MKTVNEQRNDDSQCALEELGHKSNWDDMEKDTRFDARRASTRVLFPAIMEEG